MTAGEELYTYFQSIMYSAITDRSMSDIAIKVKDILNKHHLHHLLFRVMRNPHNPSAIVILGFREIDRYALIALFEEGKPKKDDKESGI